jgi:hypothetical protein
MEVMKNVKKTDQLDFGDINGEAAIQSVAI